MEARIDLLTVLTDNVPRLVAFYRDVLGMKVRDGQDESGDYVEFEHTGVRFAICARKVLRQVTGDASYDQGHAGHCFELAFPVDIPGDVDREFIRLVEAGAKGVKEPGDTPWGQYAAFFADPDGNIHEIFSRSSASER